VEIDPIQQTVREKYRSAAENVLSGGCQANCCDSDPVSAGLYAEGELAGVPAEAVQASLGCGNPVALAELRPGEVVLDLGSGGGIDVLLSARRVGPHGKAYGLDMTGEMLALARHNQQRAGIANAEFLQGVIENIPLPEAAVDVVLSNCVINLSADKDRVLREAYRVLKPGGRLAVSDVVVRGAVPEEIRRHMLLWAGCIAGAMEESEYRAKLAAVGFEQIELEPVRVYGVEAARGFLAAAGIDVDAIAPLVEGRFFSAFVRAVKPRDSRSAAR
jgi:SAM-dependent methyltransferase